jgi:hypothetical protein
MYHHIIDPSSSIGFHLIIYHSHQGQYHIILIKDNTYTLSSIINQSIINQSINQSLDINQSINQSLTSINQTIGINDNMIQQSPPLALMAIPTLMSTPITNY